MAKRVKKEKEAEPVIGDVVIRDQEYEMVPIDRVKPHPKNPRKGRINEIIESYGALGFYGALVVQKSTGYILAGNHRWYAAIKAGMREIPVIWVDCDEKVARKIMLADNKIADMALYDERLLLDVLKEIRDEEQSLVGTGWEDGDLDALIVNYSDDIGNPAEMVCDKPVEEVMDKWRVERGQVWEADGYRIMCGDALSYEDMDILMGGEKARLLFTDPPWQLNVSSFGKFMSYDKQKRIRGYNRAYKYGERDLTEHIPYEDWLEVACGYLEDNASLLVFEMPKNCFKLYEALNKFAKFQQLLVWYCKNRCPGGMIHRRFANKFDVILWAVRNNKFVFSKKYLETGGKSTVFDIVEEKANTTEKTGQSVVFGSKPIEVLIPFICTLTLPGDIVLDIFMGSGSTLIASYKVGRRCYGMEIEPKHVSVILERMESQLLLKPKRVR